MEHVNNAYAVGHAQANAPVKHDSQFVSTCGYGMLKVLDPTFAQQIMGTSIYKIDTAVALLTGNFSGANDVFDPAGDNRPRMTQREWIKLGSIDQAAVIETMTGAPTPINSSRPAPSPPTSISSPAGRCSDRHLRGHSRLPDSHIQRSNRSRRTNKGLRRAGLAALPPFYGEPIGHQRGSK